MGQQRRYARRVGDLEVPTSLAHRVRIDEAAEAIAAHLARTGMPGIFAGDGLYLGSLADRHLAILVRNPDRLHRGPNVDGSDTLLLVDPDEALDDIRERLYRSRRWASPRAEARHEVAEAIYAAIDVGAMPAEPTQHIEALVDLRPGRRDGRRPLRGSRDQQQDRPAGARRPGGVPSDRRRDALAAAAMFAVQSGTALPVDQIRRVAMTCKDADITLQLLQIAAPAAIDIMPVLNELGDKYTYLTTWECGEFEVPHDEAQKAVFKTLHDANLCQASKKPRKPLLVVKRPVATT